MRRGPVQVDDHVVLRHHQLQRADHIPEHWISVNISATEKKRKTVKVNEYRLVIQLTERGSPLFHDSPHYRYPEGSKQQIQ